jgi:undecaprenyl diphosphate synthase
MASTARTFRIAGETGRKGTKYKDINNTLAAVSKSRTIAFVLSLILDTRDVSIWNTNANDINEDTISNNLFTAGLPDVDFMVRSSGEQRISNFLLYQIAYAELYFTKTHWPDFDKDVVYECLKEFEKRQRRFGGA